MYPSRIVHTPYCVVICNIFYPHYLIKGSIFRKEFLNIKWVFRLYVQPLSETFLILRCVKPDGITNVQTSSYNVFFLFLLDSNQTWILSTDFSKYTQITNFMKIRPMGAQLLRTDGQIIAEGRTDWQADMTKFIVAFCSFENAPKKCNRFSRAERSFFSV